MARLKARPNTNLGTAKTSEWVGGRSGAKEFESVLIRAPLPILGRQVFAGPRDILMAAAAFPPFGQFSRSFLRKHAFSQ
jgi:hypothetical protein